METFEEFIGSDTDRSQFICSFLEKRGVKCSILNIKEKKHIYVSFPQNQYNGFFKIKTILAHYDRAENSPGANDNSFAVYNLMKWAVLLQEKNIEHNIRLIFTDGEELGSSQEGLKAQGAYDLASTFKRLNILNDYIYVFDCMGRGSIPILAKEVLLKNAGSNFKKNYSKLYENTKFLLLNSVRDYLTLPVSLSDNAGFIALGLPAVLITMLPKEEAFYYLKNLMEKPELETFITKKILPPGKSFEYYNSLLPESWRNFHSEKDNAQSITWESSEIFFKILNNLAAMKISL